MAAPALSAVVRSLAEADFSALAKRFSDAGYAVALPAPGILKIKSTGAGKRASILLSVGVHGDETGPIELLSHVLDALSLQPCALAADLMVCIGNPAAILAGKRFIDADLNRMFRADRAAMGNSVEAGRADAIIAETEEFFAGAGLPRWHLDLHSAIRPSVYPTFAVMPDLISDETKALLTGWLGQAGIGAIIINPKSSGTYSYYCAEHFGAAASTIELGRVGALGQNDLSVFADVALTLDNLLRGAAVVAGKVAPPIFSVVQEIIKLTDKFSMASDCSTQNFTSLPAGAVIATDGDTVYTVKHAEELVVFPNPGVRVGLRAGLMVVRRS